MLIALLCVVAQSSWAQSGTISYIERSWDAANDSVVETTRTLTAGDYTLLSSDLFDDDGDINLNEGNYVLKEDLTVPGRILLRGTENCTFNIILGDKGFNVVVNGAEGLTFGGSAGVGAK